MVPITSDGGATVVFPTGGGGILCDQPLTLKTLVQTPWFSCTIQSAVCSDIHFTEQEYLFMVCMPEMLPKEDIDQWTFQCSQSTSSHFTYHSSLTDISNALGKQGLRLPNPISHLQPWMTQLKRVNSIWFFRTICYIKLVQAEFTEVTLAPLPLSDLSPPPILPCFFSNLMTSATALSL